MRLTEELEDRGEASRPFTARFRDRCADPSCGEDVDPGDEVRYVEGKLVHNGCLTGSSEPGVSGTPCPSCWLVGPCDCD